MPRIVLASVAEDDLAGIWAYIAQDDPSAADALLKRFDGLFLTVSLHPSIGKSVGKLAPNMRLIPIGAYLVFYRPIGGGVQIARILHSARDITSEFFRD